MERTGPVQDVDALLSSLQDGLRMAERQLAEVLEHVAADSTRCVGELEVALSDMEASLNPE